MEPHTSDTIQHTFAEELNAPQRQAVAHLHGPALVFAGAGSGKTRVIVHRIVQLIETHHINPESICALTFTNKAAKEMKERAIALNAKCRHCLISTFHSASAKWLRQFAHHLGFESHFSILDTKESDHVLKKIIQRYEDTSSAETYVNKTNLWQASSVEEEPQRKPTAEYREAIQRLKGQGLIPHAPATVAICNDSKLAFLHKIYADYQRTLKHNHSMDFSDLLLNMLTLLRTHKDVKEALMSQYEFFLVDEYQDVNVSQFELLNHLTPKPHNLMVVGDDDQAIYSWRGADPYNILNFQANFQHSTIIHLEQNYRSTGHIIAAANALISRNTKRADKKLWTEAPPGHRIELIKTRDGTTEADTVCRLIQQEQSSFPLTDVAIFYRTNAQSREIEDRLTFYNIPYKIYGSLRFYDRSEIKDILAYFRLCVNHKDDAAFLRLIKTPSRGLGSKSIEALSLVAHQHYLSLYDVIETIYEDPKNSILKGLKPRLISIATSLYTELNNLRKELLSSPLEDVISVFLAHVPYLNYLQSHYPDIYQDKLENTKELGAAIAAYASAAPQNNLAHWLQDVSLLGSENEDLEGVSLMSLHASKGLEYPRVYIIGCDDGLLPHAASLKDEDIEEERRLLYVGITRTKAKLTLTTAALKRVYNEHKCFKPSRFLKEIPSEYMDSYSPENLQERYQ
ncbi:MAG: UvrD-helicase domain-containing protein [Proteobacteria bacterium]|nr:UvrD-helicase domain-containing protein [Pseudomonadota bacterium]